MKYLSQLLLKPPLLSPGLRLESAETCSRRRQLGDNPGSRTAPPMTRSSPQRLLYAQLSSLDQTEGDALGRHQLPLHFWLLSPAKVSVDFHFSLTLTSEDKHTVQDV